MRRLVSLWHLICLDKPKRDPGAHDNDCERDVDLEEVESECPLKSELDKDDGPVAPPHGVQTGPVGPVDHHILGQAQLLHAVEAKIRFSQSNLHITWGAGPPTCTEGQCWGDQSFRSSEDSFASREEICGDASYTWRRLSASVRRRPGRQGRSGWSGLGPRSCEGRSPYRWGKRCPGARSYPEIANSWPAHWWRRCRCTPASYHTLEKTCTAVQCNVSITYQVWRK